MSMPCESAASGLVALGVMMRDLGNPRANEIEGHYDHLLSHANQYLSMCRDCGLAKCKPEDKKCGYTSKATGKIRSIKPKDRGTYLIDGKTDFEGRQIAFTKRGVIVRPYPEHATGWHIDGEPPCIKHSSDGSFHASFYQELVKDLEVHGENLSQSFSGLCLAGRSTGKSVSRKAFSSIKFLNGRGEAKGLDELLTVFDWIEHNISRVAYFNPRTGKPDRPPSPGVVVADGDAPFLKVLNDGRFEGSDVIGVMSRVVDRDRLDEVGAAMSKKLQWYETDEEMMRGAGQPQGVSVSVLKRREK